MNKIIYQVGNILIRPFDEDVLENSNYLDWFYDQEVTKFNSHGIFTFPIDAKQFIESNKANILWAVLMPRDLEGDALIHIGNVSLQNIDWINRSAEVALLFGEKDYWRKGIATNVLEILFDHAFLKMGLNRLYLGTPVTNTGMTRVAEKLGMSLEGISQQSMFLNGDYTDVANYGLLRRHWGSVDIPVKKGE